MNDSELRPHLLEIKNFLDAKVEQYKTPKFIEEDPIQIPKKFENLQEIEIAAFLTSTIAWGQRKSIIKNAQTLMDWMGNAPFDFVMNAKEPDFPKVGLSVHRTFKSEDFRFFILNLRRLYSQHSSLENYFLLHENEENMMEAIERFRKAFIITSHRGEKHVSSPTKGSAAKRLNMFLRWMVRDDSVDLGLWKNLPISALSIPLDVHTGNTLRKLNLLQRRQNDRKAVSEVDYWIRQLDAKDPAAYDFALFGLGVYEKF